MHSRSVMFQSKFGNVKGTWLPRGIAEALLSSAHCSVLTMFTICFQGNKIITHRHQFPPTSVEAFLGPLGLKVRRLIRNCKDPLINPPSSDCPPFLEHLLLSTDAAAVTLRLPARSCLPYHHGRSDISFCTSQKRYNNCDEGIRYAEGI